MLKFLWSLVEFNNKYFPWVFTAVIAFILVGVVFFTTIANAKRLFHEKHYQEFVCEALDGIEEHRLKDRTRVDCVTTINAIEFDFSNKWAEAIGQSLYYAMRTGLKPMIYIIDEQGTCKNYKKIKDTITHWKLPIEVEYISHIGGSRSIIKTLDCYR
jgi:hypothetical protein